MANTSNFDDNFRDWVASACEQWNYPSPPDNWYAKTYTRMPNGLRKLIAVGVDVGCIIPRGYQFTLAGIKEGKGPYAWLSRSSMKQPTVNWEYFVQAAEYCRLRSVATEKGLSVTFEDGLMDIAVYADNELLICCEVKEKASKLRELVSGMKRYQEGVGSYPTDKENDSLKKSNYLVTYRPKYFSAVAIGLRLEFSVTYQGKDQFELHEDVIPL